MARKINDYLGSHFPAEVLNAANQQAAGYYDILPSRAEMLNQQMTHMPQQTPYQQFQQAYPQLDQYGRDVVTGQVAKRGLLNLADNLNKAYTDPSALQDYIGFGGMTAFHGSPHKFSKFMMDKIGTGEGAQAYGHGLYFAESPGVAKSYTTAGTPMYLSNVNTQKFGQDALDAAKKAGKTGDDAITEARSILWPKYQAAVDPIEKSTLQDAYNNIAEIAKGKGKGNLYEVDIPDTQINKMLDWDKPLSEQSIFPKDYEGMVKAHKPGSTVTVEERRASLLNAHKNQTGANFYHDLLQRSGGDQKQASAMLNSLGIKGIKYFDQASRGAKEGTRNFVVFDENIVKILNRK